MHHKLHGGSGNNKTKEFVRYLISNMFSLYRNSRYHKQSEACMSDETKLSKKKKKKKN